MSSSQSELRAEPASSETPLPSSPIPIQKSTQETTSQSPTKNNLETTQKVTSPAPTPTTPSPQPPKPPRLQTLETKHHQLTQKLLTLQQKRSELVQKATLPSGLSMPETWSEEEKTAQALATSNARIKEHIDLLHSYNEIKDIGQGLLGLVAEKRGVRIATVMEDFEMGEKD